MSFIRPELLLVEEGIPFAHELFGFFDSIESYHPASGVENHPRSSRATALLIRSATKINPGLRSFFPNLKLVGTTTAGTDHISPWPELKVVNAPGCNAEAVADYVCSALFSLGGFVEDLYQGVPFGIIGVGETGGRVADRLEKLGFSVKRYDPLKEKQGFRSADWEEILSCPYISIHTPLTFTGEFPTDDLLDQRFFASISPGTVLINCARGGVVDEEALLKHREKLGHLILDVYKNEPRVNPSLLSAADLATPHIAGYSSQAFVRGAVRVSEYFRSFLGIEKPAETSRYYRTENIDCQFPLNSLQEIPRLLDNIFSLKRLSNRFKEAGRMEIEDFIRMRAQAVRPENSFIRLNLPGTMEAKVKETLKTLQLM